jgi:hypothetical protein
MVHSYRPARSCFDAAARPLRLLADPADPRSELLHQTPRWSKLLHPNTEIHGFQTDRDASQRAARSLTRPYRCSPYCRDKHAYLPSQYSAKLGYTVTPKLAGTDLDPFVEPAMKLALAGSL